MNKVIIGSANFGLNYGINNDVGKLSLEEMKNIFITARNNGINYIDTAQAYGNAEERIGHVLQSLGYLFNMVTKFKFTNLNDVENLVDDSFRRLNVKQLYGVLFHDFNNYKTLPDSWEILKKYRERGQVKKIGFSLYYPKELDFLLDHEIDFDIIQVPYNIFDRRFEPYFPRLKKKKVEIHTRSVFLQGLVFKKPTDLPKEFKEAKDKINRMIDFSKEFSLSLASICLNFVAANHFVDKMVIGVDSSKQLERNIFDISIVKNFNKLLKSLDDLIISDEKIILPFNWKLL